MARYSNKYSSKKRRSAGATLVLWGLTALVATWGLWNLLTFARHGAPAATPAAPVGAPLQWVEPAAAQSAADPFNGNPAPSTDAAAAENPAAARPPRPLLAPGQAAMLRDAADRALAAGDSVTGRGLLNQTLGGMPDAQAQDDLRQRLAALNTAVFLGPAVLTGDPYVLRVLVAPGDSFVRLGHKYQVPGELLAAVNPQVSPRKVRAGSLLKVVRGPFHIHVLKGAGRLDLYARDMYVRSFAGSFDEGNYLPAGLYRVRHGGKIMLRGAGSTSRRWVLWQGAVAGPDEPGSACLYGSAGPRAGGDGGLSGVRCSDEDLAQLYNTLVEQESLLRVDP